MSDANDDTAADDASSATAEASAQSSNDSDVEPGVTARTGDPPPPSVAAKAGIDEDILDVPRKLESMVRLQWIIRSTIGAVVIGVVTAVVAYVISIETTYLAADVRTAAAIGGTVFGLFALYGVVRAVLLYRSWVYVIRVDSLYLSRGVFTRVRTVVPYIRVQHIDTTRRPLERLLGLSTLVVYTAGSRGADVTIPGLTPDRASTLQRRLKRLAIDSEEEDAV